MPKQHRQLFNSLQGYFNMSNQTNAMKAIIARLNTDSKRGQGIKTILDMIAHEAIGLQTLSDNPDMMKSGVAQAMLINQEKARLRDVTNLAREKLKELVSEYASEQDAARVSRANLVPTEHAAEIRSVFRALDAAAKSQFLSDAIRTRDAATVAAIVAAPAVLTGISAERVSQYREMYLDSYARIAPQHAVKEMQSVIDVTLGIADSMAIPSGHLGAVI
jgi:hypothetical protein